MLEEELGLSPHVLGRGIFQGQHHINGLLETTDAQLKEDLALLVRGLLCGVFLLLLLCTWRVYDCTVCVCGWVGGWIWDVGDEGVIFAPLTMDSNRLSNRLLRLRLRLPPTRSTFLLGNNNTSISASSSSPMRK